MRREKQYHVLSSSDGIGDQLIFDVLNDCIDQSRVCRPTINYTPGDGSSRLHFLRSPLSFKSCSPLPQLIQGTAGGRARILWILRECDSSSSITISEPVRQQSIIHLLRQWICVSEREIWLVWGCLRRGFIENLAHCRAL